MNPRNFFAELKRRNVYKVAVAYAVVGWLVMQIAATVVPALHLPDGITTGGCRADVARFPDRARHRVGLRDDAGWNETDGERFA